MAGHAPESSSEFLACVVNPVARLCPYNQVMAAPSGKVHVVRVRKTGYVDKEGGTRDYSSAYLRRSYREGGKVKNQTSATPPPLPAPCINLHPPGLKRNPP